ncbi:MAG: RNA polymerase sigma factor [Candidatus Krumholzibacteriia bacterium]
MSTKDRDDRDAADEELVRVAQAAGHTEAGRAAIGELFARYHKRVYLWCFRYVREHEKALDLSQDVFLNAYRGLGSFGGRSKFSSWLFAITRNRALNEMRRVGVFQEEDADAADLADERTDPGRQLEEREGQERIYRLIRTALDPLEQKAIWLRCFERLPVDEITALLNVDSTSGARGVLQRARRKLRAALEDNPGES